MRVLGSGRPAVVGVSLMLAAGLAVGGCGGSSPAPLACPAQSAAADHHSKDLAQDLLHVVAGRTLGRSHQDRGRC